MKYLYALIGMAILASPAAADNSFSDNEKYISQLNSFTEVATYIVVGDKVVLDDPTKSGKPVYILAGSPQVDFGDQVGFLPTATIVLVGKNCSECTMVVNRYSTGGEFDHFIIEFKEP